MIIKTILSVLAFIIFAPFAGAIATGITRKVSARSQNRDGGAILQPLSDVITLLQKSKGENSGFQGYYVKVSLFFNILAGGIFFAGTDMLMTIAAMGLSIIFLILAAYTSGTYYARIGADRLTSEMVAAAPMMFMVVIGFYIYCGSFSVRDIAFNAPIAFLPLIGIFIGFILIPCTKLRNSSFEYRMPHAMYQRDMSSLSDAFNKKDAAICEISSWYEKTILYAFVFLYFTNGKVWMIPIAVAACVIVCVLQGVIENVSPTFDTRRAFKFAWCTALILGVINLIVVYIFL